MSAPEYEAPMPTGQDQRMKDDLGKDEPQAWSVPKKLLASSSGFLYAFALLFTATSYTAAIPDVAKKFDVSMVKAILPFSLFIFGIAFAPLYTPHVSERVGRKFFYLAATLGMACFTLGAAYSDTYTALAVCRFFAGLFGGSNAVQIEGTFADIWPGLYTSSYYTFITGAQYFGAATAVIINWHVVPDENLRWTEFTSLMVILLALIVGVVAPETFRRKLVRRQAKKMGVPSPLAPAQSGTTFKEMAHLTVVQPIIMFFTQPIVTLITLYLGLNFGVLFQFFVSVPVVLMTGPKFGPDGVGDAFTTAIGGTAVAIILVLILDQLIVRTYHKRLMLGSMDIEFRIVAGIIGALAILASLFWIAYTINPSFKPAVPVAGNGVYVMGSAMVLTSFVPYLFDAYSPPGTLSALTAAAVFRVALAGAIPLTVPAASANIGAKWFLATFGFISILFLFFPVFFIIFGRKLRTSSKYFDQSMLTPMHMEMKMESESSGEESRA